MINRAVKPIRNFTTIPITQALDHNVNKQGHLGRRPWNAFSHHSPVNVSGDEIPCILFWAKRITIKFKNQTWLDLTDEAFSEKGTMDLGDSNCSDKSATNEGHSYSEGWCCVCFPRLSLKFSDGENPEVLDVRFILANHKLSVQSWFSLHQVEIVFNNSVQATFNAAGIYAPSGHSYHCQHVSSRQRYGALLLPGDTDAISSLWEVTFIDFQIQGFSIKGGEFSKAQDCVSSFSPAILIGLIMSLILLLTLASALYTLIYLRDLDRHYSFITSPTHWPQLKAQDVTEEKELLRSQGVECYVLRSQHTCKMYV